MEDGTDDDGFVSTMYSVAPGNPQPAETVAVPRSTYAVLMKLEAAYEDALRHKANLRRALEAGALDLELTELQLRVEMDALQCAAVGESVFNTSNTSNNSNKSNTSNGSERAAAMKERMHVLSAERAKIEIADDASGVLASHAKRLQALERAAGDMVDAVAHAREQLDAVTHARNGVMNALRLEVATLHDRLASSNAEAERAADAQQETMATNHELHQLVAQLRSQLALVEAEASESLHVALAQHGRERQAVARLESALDVARQELSAAEAAVVQWKARAGAEEEQRCAAAAAKEALEQEKHTWQQALAAAQAERDAAVKAREQAAYALDVQGKFAAAQVHDLKATVAKQRLQLEERQEEVRQYKDELRQALEAAERSRHDGEASGGAHDEVTELRERVRVLRAQLDVAEAKLKALTDERDDLVRSHRHRVADLDDALRRQQAELSDVRAQEAKLAPAVARADGLAQQVFTLTQESKDLATQIAKLQAENARLTLLHRGGDENDPGGAAPKNVARDLAQAQAVAEAHRLECDRLRVELAARDRRAEAQDHNMQALEARRDFLAAALKDAEEHAGRLSAQLRDRQPDGGGGGAGRQIAELRALVPHWRFEEQDRHTRAVYPPAASTSSGSSPARDTSGSFLSYADARYRSYGL